MKATAVCTITTYSPIKKKFSEYKTSIHFRKFYGLKDIPKLYAGLLENKQKNT